MDRCHAAALNLPLTIKPLQHVYTAVFALLAVAATWGCGSISFKPGGTSSDYQAAADRCKQEGHGGGVELNRCMEEQGWIVKDLGAPAATTDATKHLPANSPPPPSQPAAAVGDVAPAPKLVDAPSAPAADRPVEIKNWFKLGGTANELAAAKKRCATKLGTAGRPETQSDVVSDEMLECMRDEGWRGF